MSTNEFEVARDRLESIGADIMFRREVTPGRLLEFIREHGEVISKALLRASKEV